MFKGRLSIGRERNTIVGVFLGNTPAGPIAHVAKEPIRDTPEELGVKLYRQTLDTDPDVAGVASARIKLARARAGRGVRRAKLIVAAFDSAALGNPPAPPVADKAAAVKGAYSAVLGECMSVAGYFSTPTLVGASPAKFAKKLAARLLARDKAAESQWRDIKARARAGKAKAQDVVYAVRRYIRESKPPAKGLTLTESHVEGFDHEALEGHIEERLGNPYVLQGACIYEALQGPHTRKRAKRAFQRSREYARVGSKPHAIVSSTVTALGRAEAERRRKRRRRRPVVLGGFDFGNFMNDVGKVAGPIAKSLAPIAKFIPFVGPVLEPALNATGDLLAEKPGARRKVETVKKLAAAGNPVARRDLAALKVAVKIRQAAKAAKMVKASQRPYRPPMFKRILLSLTPYRAGSRRFGFKVAVR